MSQKLEKTFLHSQLLCPNCNKALNIVTDPESGELICPNCGMVVSEKTEETRAEWNAFSNEQNIARSRTGAPTSLARHDRGLSTIIGKINKDASGQEINMAMRSRIGRWRTWDFRTQNYRSIDRSLNIAFTKLDMMKSNLGLPDSAIEKIAYLYRKIQEKGLVRGRTIQGALAVAAYITCRHMEIPRTIRDISEIANVNEKEISKLYRKVMVELDLKIPQVDPMKNIVKIANKCGIAEKPKRYAIKRMDEIIKAKMTAGKDPMGLAGAVLYMACKYHNESITQYQIAEAAGVTEVTIRHNLNSISKMLNVPLKRRTQKNTK